MGYCHRCMVVLPDEWLYTCYHFDKETVLGVLCDECVADWYEYERYMREEE